MDDVAPRRSCRKRTASSRLQDMLCTKQITKTRVDRLDGDRKSAKTETESLDALRRICGSDRKKDGKDESNSSAVPVDGDNDLVIDLWIVNEALNQAKKMMNQRAPWKTFVANFFRMNLKRMVTNLYSGTAGNLQNGTSTCSTDVTVEIQPCRVVKKSSQAERIRGHNDNTGDRLQSEVKENNQNCGESDEQEQRIVGEKQEQTQQELGWFEEQVQPVMQDKEQGYEIDDEQSEQVMEENMQVTQEMSAEEEDELVEEGVDEGYLEEIVGQGGQQVEQVEQLTGQVVEQVEDPRIEQEGQVEDQENIIRNPHADVDGTNISHSDFGASVKESHSYVNTMEEIAETQLKIFTDEDNLKGSAGEARSCVLVQECNILFLKPTDVAHHGGDAAKIDDTSPIHSSTNTTDSRSQSTLIHHEQGDVSDSVVCTQYNVTDDGDVAMVSSTDVQESTEDLAQSPSALGDGIMDAATYLEFASAVKLISNVLQRSSDSQDNVVGATPALSYESKMDSAGSTISTTDASVALLTGTGGDFNQTASVQQIDGSNEDAEFVSSNPPPGSQDKVVQPTEKVSVCVVHSPNVDTDQPLDRSVIINVIQMPGGSPSGDSDSPVEDATGDSAVADPDVDEGGLDMAEARVTMEPSMTCVDGVFTCGICAYTTDKKANWYKHKVHHTGRRPYACDKCPYSATTSSNLRRHQLIHAEVRSFQCSICDIKFRQKIHLERHIKYKHQEKSVGCPHCDYQCASVNPDLKVHMQRRHQIGLDHPAAPMRCADCGFTTTSRKDLRQHEKFHKSGPELKLYCEQCCFVTDCQSRLKRHLLTHTRERPFSCELCGYRATQKEHVARHMRAKHDSELDKTENQRTREQNRETLSHENGSGFIDNASEDPPETALVATQSFLKRRVPQTDFCNKEKLFACNFCTMSFAKLINLYKHVSVQHGNTTEAIDGLHACVVCEYRSTSRNNLLVHMRKHNAMASGDAPSPHKLYSCVVCQFLHPHRQTLYEHMRKQHNMQIIVSRGSVHCLIDADKSGGDPDKHPISDQDAELLQLASNPHADATPNDESYEGMNAAEKLQAMARMIEDDNIPTEDVAMHDNTTVPTDHDDATIDHDDATIDHNDATIDQEVKAATDVIKMCTDELSHLSSGDFVEINGEMYKVEFSNKK